MKSEPEYHTDIAYSACPLFPVIHDMKAEGIIFDYADMRVAMLTRMYEKRLIGYRGLGYEVEE